MSSEPETTSDDAQAELLEQAEQLIQEERRQRVKTVSANVADGLLPLAFTAERFSRDTAGGDTALLDVYERMLKNSVNASNGKQDQMERMLHGQAVALNAIFVEMARRAGQNLGQSLTTVDAYMRIALKAQAQSRATMQTLIEAKNPRTVSFVKAGQANIAAGPQQVNNGTPGAASRAHASSGEDQANELLRDDRHEQVTLDARAPGEGSRSHSPVEAVGAVDGAENPRGQGPVRRKQSGARDGHREAARADDALQRTTARAAPAAVDHGDS